jgi:hypothetical protein
MEQNSTTNHEQKSNSMETEKEEILQAETLQEELSLEERALLGLLPEPLIFSIHWDRRSLTSWIWGYGGYAGDIYSRTIGTLRIRLGTGWIFPWEIIRSKNEDWSGRTA